MISVHGHRMRLERTYVIPHIDTLCLPPPRTPNTCICICAGRHPVRLLYQTFRGTQRIARKAETKRRQDSSSSSFDLRFGTRESEGANQPPGIGTPHADDTCAAKPIANCLCRRPTACGTAVPRVEWVGGVAVRVVVRRGQAIQGLGEAEEKHADTASSRSSHGTM